MKKSKFSLGLVGVLVGAIALVAGVFKKRPLELASSPTDLSLKSWKRAFLETKTAIGNKNLGSYASAVAYGGTLAFFPLVVASVAIASMVITPGQINEVVAAITNYLPKDMAALLSEQLKNALDHQSANGIIAIAAIALALFGVSGAMNSLVNSLNVTYNAEETRSGIKVRLTSLGLTVFFVLGMIITLPLIMLGGDLLTSWGVPSLLVSLFAVLRWVILAAVMTVGLAVVYRYAPNRPREKWQWVSWGAMMATLLWLIVTALFFIYVQYFANFSQSYSLFAGIIVLMMWLNFSSLIILVGAEVNYRLERRVPATLRQQ